MGSGNGAVAAKWIRLCGVPMVVSGFFHSRNCPKCHLQMVQIIQQGSLPFGLVKEGAVSKGSQGEKGTLVRSPTPRGRAGGAQA